MSRLVILGILIFGLAMAGLATVRAELLILAVPLAVYFLASLVSSAWDARVKISRAISSRRVLAGSLVEVTIKIENLGEALDQVWLEEPLPAGLQLIDGKTHLFERLSTAGSLELHYSVRAQRGIYLFPAFDLHYSDVYSLVPRHLHFQQEDTIAVLPESLRLDRIPIRPPRTHGFNGSIPARRGGPGITFYGLRDYQPGDELRWINWRASARSEQALFTNEYQQESTADVGIILDARYESYLVTTGKSLFEHAVTATASLAEALINDGNRVGLVHYGKYVSWTYPGYGKMQRERIMNALSQASPGDSQVDRLEYLPARFVPPGSQLVLVSPLLEQDLETLLQLRSRRYALLVVSPNPVAYEASCLPDTPETQMAIRVTRLERLLLLQPLRQAGIQVLDWDTNIPFDQAIQRITRGAGRFWMGSV